MKNAISVLSTITCILFFSSALAQNLDYQWAINYGASGSDDETMNDLFVDQNGFSYTVGEFEGTIDFDPGAGADISTSLGLNDAFIQKLDQNGNFVWSRVFQGASNVYAFGVFVDSLGNVFVCGGFQGDVDFDPGTVGNELTGGGMYLLKLDSNGNFQWVKHLSGNSYSYAWRVEGYQSHLVVAGSFQGTVDFDPNAGVQEETSAGSNDVFVLSLDFDGNFEWVKRMGGGSQDAVEDLSIHADGRIAVTGWFRNTSDFDPGSGTSNLTSASANKDDIFVVSLTNSGDFEWAHSFGGVEYDDGRSVAFDSNGSVYVSGFFEGSADFDPSASTHTLTGNGDWEIFIVKLSSSGNFEWAHSFGEADNDIGYDLAVDADDNVYLTGYYEGTVDWDPGAATNSLSSSAADMFLLKLDPQGNYSSIVTVTASSNQAGYSVFADQYNGIWVGGEFRNTVDLAGDIVETAILSPVGSQDNCLLYFSQCDIDTSVTQTGYLLTANETAGTYQWYDCDNQTIIPGENSASFSPADNGTYAVILEQGSCADTSKCHTISGLSIDEIEVAKLTISPNPASDFINFTLPNNETPSSITILDLKGAIVKEINPADPVSVSDLNAGAYILVIETGEKSYRARFIK